MNKVKVKPCLSIQHISHPISATLQVNKALKCQLWVEWRLLLQFFSNELAGAVVDCVVATVMNAVGFFVGLLQKDLSECSAQEYMSKTTLIIFCLCLLLT